MRNGNNTRSHAALENLVRNLREKLYFLTKHTYAHERVWEDEEQEKWRENYNKQKREAWDIETEELIQECYHD